KNAILIIEFAKEHQEAGMSLKDSVMIASRQRLRPIIMTSLAFGLGVLPLYLATGPGAGSQNAIGTSVVGGVLTATFLGIFFIPMFYVWVRTIFKYKGDGTNNGSGNGVQTQPNPALATTDTSTASTPANFGDNTQ